MSISSIVGLVIGMSIACLIIGIFLGFVISKKITAKQMEKNPPITRDQIRAMYAQMGRKPTEAQINQVMGAMKKNNK